MTPVLQAERISCRYDQQLVLDQVALSIEQGEICALLGPSGCGKTTLLKALAGLVPLEQGHIHIQDRCIHGKGVRTAPEQRGIGLIFQDYALFPHLSVAGNITFGLRHHPTARQAAICRQMLSLVGLSDLGKRYPHELSGGQQQRVALARSLARSPELLLLDEPFSNIDARVRAELVDEVRALLKQQQMAAVLVTHNKEEAFAFADRILVLHQGRIIQQGTPEELYNRPGSRFVAELLGSANWLPVLSRQGESLVTALGTFAAAHHVVIDGQVLLRPQQISLHKDPEGEGRVVRRRFQGATVVLGVEWQDQLLDVEQSAVTAPGCNERVELSVTGALQQSSAPQRRTGS